MSKVVKRFLEYVKYDTKPDEGSSTIPSTKNQLVLARAITEELKAMGLSDVSLDNNGYVMAQLPSNVDKKVPVIGFIAHMDTSPDMSGKDVKPLIFENYDGSDLVLNSENKIVLSPKEFPEIKNYIGKTLITTDGTTLLGADDKAGIAEIITAIEYLVHNPEILHGTIKIGFTPDEEIGRGANSFDVERFGAEFAYTLDGGRIGELEYENFNAAGAKVIVKGKNIHPGNAKSKMINSIFIANEFASMLPQNEKPETTSGYEGFYHLNSMQGEVEETILHYIIRDFDKENFENRKQIIKKLAEELNKKHGESTITVQISDQYYNMKEKLEPVKHIVDIVFDAMVEVGVEPIVKPIRGGTDGARLSFMGLPTPNIFAGGENFHGRYEYIPTFAMEKAVEVILKIVDLYAQRA